MRSPNRSLAVSAGLLHVVINTGVYDASTDYVLATFSIKFLGGGSGSHTGGCPAGDKMVLKDADGVSYQPMYGYTMPLSTTAHLEQTLYKGDSIKYRQAFTVPKGTELQSLILRESDCCPYAVDLSTYKAP